MLEQQLISMGSAGDEQTFSVPGSAKNIQFRLRPALDTVGTNLYFSKTAGEYALGPTVGKYFTVKPSESEQFNTMQGQPIYFVADQDGQYLEVSYIVA